MNNFNNFKMRYLVEGTTVLKPVCGAHSEEDSCLFISFSEEKAIKSSSEKSLNNKTFSFFNSFIGKKIVKAIDILYRCKMVKNVLLGSCSGVSFSSVARKEAILFGGIFIASAFITLFITF